MSEDSSKSAIDSMYRQLILDHYKAPLNKGKLLSPDIFIEDSNPLCGDTICVSMNVKDNILKDILFEGKGCALSIATASILSEEIKGLSLDDIKKMSREDVFALLGIDVAPARVKCVMLALSSIKKGIFDFESKKL